MGRETQKRGERDQCDEGETKAGGERVRGGEGERGGEEEREADIEAGGGERQTDPLILAATGPKERKVGSCFRRVTSTPGSARRAIGGKVVQERMRGLIFSISVRHSFSPARTRISLRKRV